MPSHAETASRFHGSNEIIECHVGVFVALGIVRLITDALAALVSAASIRHLEHLIDRRNLGIVDWSGADFRRQFQAILQPIHNHHVACTFKYQHFDARDTGWTKVVLKPGMAETKKPKAAWAGQQK